MHSIIKKKKNKIAYTMLCFMAESFFPTTSLVKNNIISENINKKKKFDADIKQK